MIEATLKARPKGCWVTDFIERHPEAQMKVIDCTVLEKSEGAQHLFEIIAPPNLTGNLIESIRNDPVIYDIELIVTKTGKIYGSIKIRDHTCGFSKMPGLHLISANSMLEGTIEWNILGDNRSFQRLLKDLDSEGVIAEVIRLSGFNGTGVLTAKQELILKMAFERGFFECPKKIHLEELAKITGTTPSALTQILRKGLRKVLRESFIAPSIYTVLSVLCALGLVGC